jgi:hypothetical protein
LDRFVRVADFLKNYDPETSGPIVECAFRILDDVSYSAGRWYTMWSIVFDMKNFQIYWINLNFSSTVDAVFWFIFHPNCLNLLQARLSELETVVPQKKRLYIDR